MNDNNSLQTNEYYKNLNKHRNCSNCNIDITMYNYKKGRTVCKLCYNNKVLRYYKNKFCSNSSHKIDVSTQTDFSSDLDSSNKQDISINNIIDSDPNHLCDKLHEILSKPNMIENDYTMCKMILDELLRTKCIPRKEYSSICKNIGLI